MSDSGQKLPWYSGGLSFACIRCGNCCGGTPGYVWVSVPEIIQIAEHLRMEPSEFERLHVRRAERRRSLLEHENGDCEFLVRHADGKTGCRIHSVRPVQCRTWPFWKSNLDSRPAWKAAAKGCPGIGQGPHYPLPVIEAACAENGDLPL